MKVGSTEMLLDGVSLVDRFGGGIERVQPGLDTVQEFRIETSGSNARYSRPATVTLVTKSGTNHLHGSALRDVPQQCRRSARAHAAGWQHVRQADPQRIRRLGRRSGVPSQTLRRPQQDLLVLRLRRAAPAASVVRRGLRAHRRHVQRRLQRVVDNNGVQHAHLRSADHQRAGPAHSFRRRHHSAKPHQPVLRRHEDPSRTRPPTRPTRFWLPTWMRSIRTRQHRHASRQRAITGSPTKDSLSGRFTRSRATAFAGRAADSASPADGLTNGFGTGRGDNRVYHHARSRRPTSSRRPF